MPQALRSQVEKERGAQHPLPPARPLPSEKQDVTSHGVMLLSQVVRPTPGRHLARTFSYTRSSLYTDGAELIATTRRVHEQHKEYETHTHTQRAPSGSP